MPEIVCHISQRKGECEPHSSCCEQEEQKSVPEILTLFPVKYKVYTYTGL